MPGPVKTPTKVLKMQGSWRADRRVEEPEPRTGRALCPRWLAGEARKAWKDLLPELEHMGILARCDWRAIVRYCQLWARWREVEEAGGSVAVSMNLSAALLRLEREFGLTPSARAGLAKEKDNPEENRGKARFFKNG